MYRRPADTFVATFVGSPKMNLVTGAVAAGELRCDGLRMTVGGPDAPAVTIGVRPDDLTLSAAADGAATVELVELLGPRAIVTVRAGDERLTSVVAAAQLADISPAPPSSCPRGPPTCTASTRRRVCGCPDRRAPVGG